MGNSNRTALAFSVVPTTAHGDYTGIDFESRGARGGYFTLSRSLTPGSTTAFPIVRLQGRIGGTTTYFDFFRFANTTSQAQTLTVLIHPDASTFGASTAFSAAEMCAMPLPAVWRAYSTNTSTGQPIWGLGANLVE